MASADRPPYRPQDVKEVSKVLEALESHTRKGKGKGDFSVKKNTYKLPNGGNVDSWKMQDWDYKNPNLPTYARGLFTHRNANGQPEILVRGYDKFFNYGEVRKTEWDNVRKNTRGPYELSVKENGCIIFIAGLEDDTILVCSKHSTGVRGDVEASHAVVGERWVEKHLASVGKTKADLARQLRAMNATAVAELCDDTFEEHVLAYTPDMAGLYLHGINLNLPEFATYPHHLVDAFAQEWGFKQTMFVMEEDIEKVKTFLDGIAETGAYNGRDTEGFVIRCQARDHVDAPWHDWFFKYKFEEPYLMYRQWRECTKAIISGRTPKVRKHKTITEEYLLFARRRLATNPKMGALYQQNHGIIALRDDFLKSRGITGAEAIRQAMESGEMAEVTSNVLLVPIATIGCGKTTLGVALCKLFGWGQFQNDNVTGKKGRPAQFVSNVAMQLAKHPVVFADRNNHQKRERLQFIQDVTRIVPNATYVALHWVHDRSNYPEIKRVLRDRVLSRGDNHQTIHAGSKSSEEIIGIMNGFLERFESLDVEKAPDSDFDLVIDLDPLVSTRDNLETVISRLNSEYPKLFPETMPSALDLDNAIEAAMNEYKPEVQHDLGSNFGGNNKKDRNRNSGKGDWRSRDGPVASGLAKAKAPVQKAPKQPQLEYFSVRIPAFRVLNILEAIFRDMPADKARFYRVLAQSRRLQTEFHVTLMHRANKEQHPDNWARLKGLYDAECERLKPAAEAEASAMPDAMEPELGVCNVQLERIVWDKRIMCFVVRLVNEDRQGGNWETTNKVAHVTVGTASKDIKPKESNDLLARWMAGGPGAEDILEEKVKGNVILQGSVRGVLSKF